MTVRELCQIQGEKEMALVSYKCPNCGGSVVFDPKKQKFCCEFCMSEFTEEEMKAAALSSTETSGVQVQIKYPIWHRVAVQAAQIRKRTLSSTFVRAAVRRS